MKTLLRWLLAVLVLTLCAVGVSAADTTVTKMDVQAVVDRYGNCDVTLTAEVNFESAASGELWLPVGTDVARISLSGYRVSKQTVDGNVWLVLKNSDGMVGAKTFVLSYRQLRAASPNTDGTQKLDLALVCPLWAWRVETLSFSVTMPKEFDAKPEFLSGYFADALAVEDTVEGQTIRGTVSGGLLDRESVHLTMDLPAGYFRLRNLQGGTVRFDMALLALLGAACLLYWFLTLRNPLPRRRVRQLPPDGVSAWELPYVMSGGGPDTGLLLTEWAALGYLTIRVEKNGRVTLRSRMPMANERRAFEAKTYAALFRKGPECAGDTPRCRRTLAHAAAGCRRFWNRRLFAADSGNPRLLAIGAALMLGVIWFRAMDLWLPPKALRMLLMLPALPLGALAGLALQDAVREAVRRTPGRGLLLPLAALALTALLAQKGGGWSFALLGLLIQVLAALGTLSGGRRTASARDRAAELRGFRRYLRTADTHRLQQLLREDSQYFYALLPYAEALGVGRAFAKRFANLPLDPCTFLEDGGSGATAMAFYRRYRRVLRKLRGTRNLTL